MQFVTCLCDNVTNTCRAFAGAGLIGFSDPGADLFIMGAAITKGSHPFAPSAIARRLQSVAH